MAQYLDDIVDYYKALAENHPTLAHNESAGNRAFEVVSYEEAFSDFRTGAQEKTFFMRLVLPTVSFSRSGNNAKKHYQCGIMVGRYYSTREGDKTAKITAWAAAEKVADDIIARMVYDSREGHQLFFNTIDTVDNLNLNGDFIDVQGDGSYAAVMYLFDFANFRCVDGAGSEFIAVGWLDLE
jgi:hypothetical protein